MLKEKQKRISELEDRLSFNLNSPVNEMNRDEIMNRLSFLDRIAELREIIKTKKVPEMSERDATEPELRKAEILLHELCTSKYYSNNAAVYPSSLMDKLL